MPPTVRMAIFIPADCGALGASGDDRQVPASAGAGGESPHAATATNHTAARIVVPR